MKMTDEQIQEFANQIAERYKPERIILFGSHARGTAHEWSDLDLLVLMPSLDVRPIEAARRMLTELRPMFALDLLVRTTTEVKQRIAWNDFFLQDVTREGKVLYDAKHRRMGGESGSGL